MSGSHLIAGSLAEGGVSSMLCQLHTYRTKPPCLSTERLAPADFLEHLQGVGLYAGQIVHVERIPARAARHGQLQHELHPQACPALPETLVPGLVGHIAVKMQYLHPCMPAPCFCIVQYAHATAALPNAQVCCN